MEYGLPTTGKLYSFIRDIVQDDALIEAYERKNGKKLSQEEKIAKIAEWDKFSNNTDISLYAYDFFKNPIVLTAKDHFKYLEEKYNLNLFFSSFIINYCSIMYQNLSKKALNHPGSVAEYSIQKVGRVTVAYAIILMLMSIASSNDDKDKNDFIGEIHRLITDAVKVNAYRPLIDEALSYKRGYKIVDFIEDLSQKWNEEKGENDKLKFQKNFALFARNNKNPSWKMFYFIINNLPSEIGEKESHELKCKFFFFFTLTSLKEALKKYFGVNQKEVASIREKLRETFASGTLTNDAVMRFSSNFPIMASNHIANNAINEFYMDVFLTDDVTVTYEDYVNENFYTNAKELAPRSFKFFDAWGNAFTILHHDFNSSEIIANQEEHHYKIVDAEKFNKRSVEEMLEIYGNVSKLFKQACSFYNFAQNYFHIFIKEAIVFELYYSFYLADHGHDFNNELQITDNALKYINMAIGFDIIEGPEEDLSKECIYNNRDSIYKVLDDYYMHLGESRAQEYWEQYDDYMSLQNEFDY